MPILFDVLLAVSDTAGEHHILSWKLAHPERAFVPAEGDYLRQSDEECVGDEMGNIDMPQALGAEQLDVGLHAIRASLNYYQCNHPLDPEEWDLAIEVIEIRPLWTGDAEDVTKLFAEVNV